MTIFSHQNESDPQRCGACAAVTQLRFKPEDGGEYSRKRLGPGFRFISACSPGCAETIYADQERNAVRGRWKKNDTPQGKRYVVKWCNCLCNCDPFATREEAQAWVLNMQEQARKHGGLYGYYSIEEESEKEPRK